MTPAGSDESFVRGFLDVARRLPERPALEVGDRRVSYAELSRRAAVLGRAIRETEPEPRPLVALLAHRSLSAYEGVLGILLAGKGYVPLSPHFPLERTRTMLVLSGSRSLVVGPECLDLLPPLLSSIEAPLTVVLPETAASPPTLAASRHRLVAACDLPPSGDPEPPAVAPESLAYLMFTSGSTGVPKGVPITHRSLLAYVLAVAGDYDETDRFSQLYDLTFDASVADLFVCWNRGACLVSIPPASVMAPARLVREKELTRWDSVPSAVRILSRLRMLGPGFFPHLRRSVFGGEALLQSDVLLWRQAAPGSVIENQYGPTECTNAVLRYVWDDRLSPARCRHGVVPIGWPFPGQSVCVVDERDHPVRLGQEGELCVAGSQVAAGYWHDPVRSQERFVRLPFSGDTFWYRTGDRVVQDEDGCFHFLGRRDDQVQVAGHRIELQEVDAVLRDALGHDGAVTLAWPTSHGSASGLYAFVADGEHTEKEILACCRARLPEYMVPQRVLFVERLPLNAHGKVDRRKLAETLERRGEGKGGSP